MIFETDVTSLGLSLIIYGMGESVPISEGGWEDERSHASLKYLPGTPEVLSPCDPGPTGSHHSHTPPHAATDSLSWPVSQPLHLLVLLPSFFLGGVFFWAFLGGTHPWHMEVPRLGVESNHSHSSARSRRASLGIEPSSSWILAGFLTAEPQWELPTVLSYLWSGSGSCQLPWISPMRSQGVGRT